MPTRRAATSLDVRPDDYELEWMIDLRYVLVNVVDIYEIYKQAIEKNYELFEENIREYLGTQGINNGIIKTLKDSVDRANFFYYNNGITIICEKCETIKGTDVDKDGKNIYGFKLDNPQIVNGCQTVNSIAEVLSHCPQDKLFSEFSKAFVLVKVFVFDADTKQKHPNLDVNIVRYTNSQNAISDKAFASKHNYFLNIQSEFKTRGLLLLVKPSDKNKFKTEYDNPAKNAIIKTKSKDLFEFFNIEEYLTIDNMIRLFFMYLKAENQKKNNDKRHPIPYYLLSFMGVSFKNKTFDEINEKLDKLFSDKTIFLEVYTFFAKLTTAYSKEYIRANNSDYNVMIKQEIDTSIYRHC